MITTAYAGPLEVQITATQRITTTYYSAAPIEKIYAAIEPHVRVKSAEAQGTDWRAIIRRELQEGPFRSTDRGMWALAVSGV